MRCKFKGMIGLALSVALTGVIPGSATLANPNVVLDSNRSAVLPQKTGEDIIDYLSGDKAFPEEYQKTFHRILKNIIPVLGDAYRLVVTLGFGLLAIAALVAAIGYGIMKDSDLVKENKRWLERILIATALLGSVLSIVGIAAGIVIS